MSPIFRYLLAIGIALSATGLTAPARADKNPYEDEEDIPIELKDAQERYADGLKKMNDYELDAACPLLQGSYDLEPSPGRLHTLAECEARQGRLSTALAHFKQFLDAASTAPPSKRNKYKPRVEKTQKRIAELEPLVPKLLVKLNPEAPWTTVVILDGKSLELSKLVAPIPVDPGAHTLTARAPGAAEVKVSVDIAKGEKKEVPLQVEIPAKPCPPPPVPTVPPPKSMCGASIAPGAGLDEAKTAIPLSIALLLLSRRRRRGHHPGS